jgi:hypothetical protein
MEESKHVRAMFGQNSADEKMSFGRSNENKVPVST